MEKFFMATVHTRSSAIIFLTIFTLVGYSKPLAILFGLIDLSGALWTYSALRKDSKKR